MRSIEKRMCLNDEKGTMRGIFFLGKHIEVEKVADSEGAEHAKRHNECHGAIINAELTKGTRSPVVHKGLKSKDDILHIASYPEKSHSLAALRDPPSML